MTSATDPAIAAFVDRVLEHGDELYRDLPWRRTDDPYAVLVSEVMLQQTQVSRVVPYYEEWLASFPTLEALAGAPLEAVLRTWRGLGYNRRAVSLKRAAEACVEAAAGGPARLPHDEAALVALPGIGPATAAGVLAFAFHKPATYLETNVRAVVLHELFPDDDGVSDRAVREAVTAARDEVAARGVDPARWNWALLDYGAQLKRSVPNPSRRSAHHTRQSAFEGSRRQKRSALLRAVMDAPGGTSEEYVSVVAGLLGDGGGEAAELTAELLAELAREGFLAEDAGRFRIA